MLLFVYGTLMQGFPNNGMMRGGQFIGTWRINYADIFDGGGCPFLRCYAGNMYKTHTVEGEIYRIDDSLIGPIDRLEGHPRFYERQQIAWYKSPSGAGLEPIYGYTMQQGAFEESKRIVSGSWRVHTESKATS